MQHLLKTPYKFPRGTTFYQQRIVGFTPNKPQGDFLPIWFTFRLLPFEFFPVSYSIAKQISQVLTEDIAPNATKYHRFCIAMDILQGWMASMGMLSTEGRVVEVPLKYEKYPVRCTQCLGLAHGQERCITTPILPQNYPATSRKGTPLPPEIQRQSHQGYSSHNTLEKRSHRPRRE